MNKLVNKKRAVGLLVRWLAFPIVIVNTYERSYESEGLAIGGQYGWVDNATRWQEECETYQRQPKQGGDDGYHQLHPRAVVSFHRRLKLEQRSFGTPSGLLEQPIGRLERAKRLWNGRKALAALVLFVGRTG